ncbi:MAG: hypothetical protein M3Y04_06550, partial [Actinomycetota bacterium]|nr:hypothetical protein [Actinomycetota bacterium]
TPGASSTVAEAQVKQMGLSAQVDRIVVAQSATSTNIPWALIVLSALLAVIGIVLIDRAAARRRKLGPPPAVTAGASSTPKSKRH